MPKYNKSLKLKPGSKPSSLQMSKQTETENEDLQERGVQAYHVKFLEPLLLMILQWCRN